MRRKSKIVSVFFFPSVCVFGWGREAGGGGYKIYTNKQNENTAGISVASRSRN